MKYKVTGAFYEGLQIYESGELKLYSKIKNSWFKGTLISIFNNSDNLIIKIKEGGIFGGKYKVTFIDKVTFKKEFSISGYKLSFKSGNQLKLNWSTIRALNSTCKIEYKNNEIGKIKMKLISLKREYVIEFQNVQREIQFYSMILFLLTESNNDFDT